MGILRGDSAVVLLDAELDEIARAAAPPSTTGLAAAGERIFASGELSSAIAVFEVRGRELVAVQKLDLGPELFGVRALAAERDRLYALDELGGRVITVDLSQPGVRRISRVGERPFAIARLENHLLVSCLTDRSLSILALDDAGFPIDEPPRRIVHDGPIWGFDAVVDDGALLIALGGVENRPLDRSIGSFGNIDSFVFVYRAAPGASPELLTSTNVSEHGVLTPKALRLSAPPARKLDVWGYGGDRSAQLEWPRWSDPPRVQTQAAPPGIASISGPPQRRLGASPLFDAWLLSDARGTRLVPVPNQPERHPLSRLGEALFFTRLMAPANRSDGPLSRFSCETCHFEGSVDGRVHHTGRGNVRASTRALFGIFGNRPYFSRALDPTLAKMVDNEFRVAGANSGTDPWFSVGTREFPWLAELGVPSQTLGPETLRAALMRFFIENRHRPSPNAFGRTRYSELERQGAALFRDRCERCHAARTLTDEPASAVAFDGWEAALFSRGGPIVWARDRRERTGIEPYVHEDGARVPSLRRLHLERPYFTDGSARDLDELLSMVRIDGDRFWHGGAHAVGRALPAAERSALRAFLDLL